MCCASLLVALSPLAAFAQTPSDHAQAELKNAQAQLTDAVGTANGLQAQAQLDATNEHQIVLAKLLAMRMRHPDMTTPTDVSATQMSATSAIVTGDMRAAAVIDEAKASLTNAEAMAANPR